MIKFVTPDAQPQIKAMWKKCFGDSQPYFDIYFREKYSDENTLAYFERDKIVASLQLLHYTFTYCGTEIPVAYISGACTLPEARRKGYMSFLLKRTFWELEQRKIPISILVPEEEWLLRFYDKYGYAQTFDAGIDIPKLETLIERHSGDLSAAYVEFDAMFRNEEMTVQKTFDDFKVIVEEAAGYDFPNVKSLTGMSRVIDAKLMLELFAKRYPEKSFSIEIYDSILKNNNLFLAIKNGKVCNVNDRRSIHLQLDIHDLAQALLGYHTSQNQALFKDIFPAHTPQIHFMLE